MKKINIGKSKHILLICLAILGLATIFLLNQGCKEEKKTYSLRLLTENYPPITFEENGKITGFATEVVKEIMRRNNLSFDIELMDWNEAYNIAVKDQNVVLFSTTRTEKREDLFYWIGPLGSYNDALYAKKGSGIQIENIADAKKIDKIGTVDGWFSTDFLESRGFENLESATAPAVNAKKLVENKLDLCIFTDITAPEILRRAGYSMNDIEQIFIIKDYEYYIAISKGTPSEIVSACQETFEEMKKDGTLSKIHKKWIPEKSQVL